MASPRQLAANRRNAGKGGPKTPEGRAAVRFNALQHGLAAVEVVLPGEDAEAFADLRTALLTDLEPANHYEHGLAREVVCSYWRLLRLRGIETAMLSHHIETRQRIAREIDGRELDPNQAVADAFMNEPYDSFKVYFRYDSAIERAYYRALQQLERSQAIRRKLEREAAAHPRSEEVSDSGIGTVPSSPSGAVEAEPLRCEAVLATAPGQPSDLCRNDERSAIVTGEHLVRLGVPDHHLLVGVEVQRAA